jgi:ER membrane protein complex subunit 1, C-terminal
MITYGLQVERAASIATAPTTLESTSVAVVSGLGELYSATQVY